MGIGRNERAGYWKFGDGIIPIPHSRWNPFVWSRRRTPTSVWDQERNGLAALQDFSKSQTVYRYEEHGFHRWRKRCFQAPSRSLPTLGEDCVPISAAKDFDGEA